MEKRDKIEKLASTRDEAMLLAKVFDRITAAEHRNIPAATPFLSPHEQALVKQLLCGMELCFFGGSERAERKLCCWLPEYLDASWLSTSESPCAAVRAQFRTQDALTHRDFLGALMGAGIKRETVGDIYVSDGQCDFLVTREILPYILQNLDSAGRSKLTLQEIPLDAIAVPEENVRLIRDTVASLRLDSIVSSGFGVSRGKAALFIESGKTELQHLPCTKTDKAVCEGDVISVRGLGKIRLDAVSGITKKGRTGILIGRFV